jgi:hypothetical protein
VVESVIASTRSGAKFSRCRRWRYLLWRKWADGPVANFLMLNPSTADEVKLDPSCTRARLYAEHWGFGALIVTNLFGWRATDPDEMKAARDPVGPAMIRPSSCCNELEARHLRVGKPRRPS